MNKDINESINLNLRQVMYKGILLYYLESGDLIHKLIIPNPYKNASETQRLGLTEEQYEAKVDIYRQAALEFIQNKMKLAPRLAMKFLQMLEVEQGFIIKSEIDIAIENIAGARILDL